jgi:hypothetical protein
MTHVKCACGSLFGIEQEDGSLAIKYRDLFRVVRGSVSGPCRKCGKQVTWPTAPYTIPTTTVWPTTWRWTVPGSGTGDYPANPYFTCNCACTRCLAGDCCMVPS